MKVTVFTSNQARHITLVNELSRVCDEVFAVLEVTSIHPGKVDDLYRKSSVMQDYFARVIEAERSVFGSVPFIDGAHVLPMKLGDLNMTSLQRLRPAFDSDVYIVFGSSYIREPLVSELVRRRAINIHMGISPYYRGSSCNFWAVYDGNADLVGATIHRLSSGLDSGDVLFHVKPDPAGALSDPFLLGMRAVRSAIDGLVRFIQSKHLYSLEALPQDKTLEIRYTRGADFTDDVAAHYLANLPSESELMRQLSRPRRQGLRFVDW